MGNDKKKNNYDDNKWFSFGETPSEILDEIVGWAKGIASELSCYDIDDIKQQLGETKEEVPDASDLEVYSFTLDSCYSPGIWEDVFECRDFILHYFPRNKENVYKYFKKTEALPIIIEILATMEMFVEDGDEAHGDFMLSMGFYGDERIAESYKEKFGKNIVNCVRTQKELGLIDYKGALERVEDFISHVIEADYCSRLKDLAFRLDVYKKFFTVEQGSPKEALLQTEREASLLQFMQWYCEKRSRNLLRFSKKNLIDAHARKAIILPPHIGDWKTGQSKYYKAIDLIKYWKQYSETLPNIPELKDEYLKYCEP